MTIKQHTKISCNPFRYLDLWSLEKLVKQADEIEAETRALVLEAIAEKKSVIAAEQDNCLIGQGHSHFVKHLS